jgi:hypothetical protein
VRVAFSWMKALNTERKPSYLFERIESHIEISSFCSRKIGNFRNPSFSSCKHMQHMYNLTDG